MICKPRLCNENEGNRARSRAKDHRTCLPRLFIKKEKKEIRHVLGMHASLFF